MLSRGATANLVIFNRRIAITQWSMLLVNATTAVGTVLFRDVTDIMNRLTFTDSKPLSHDEAEHHMQT